MSQKPDKQTPYHTEPKSSGAYRHSFYSDFAWQAQYTLIRNMTSGWPRRGCNLLEFYCADGRFLESFWEAGFEITGHEQNPELSEAARKRLGQRGDILLNSPEQMPFDDQYFDYVVWINGPCKNKNSTEIIREAFRLASKSILLAFPNKYSLHAMGSALDVICSLFRKPATDKPDFFSPFRLWYLINLHNKGGKITWRSNLLGPSSSWQQYSLLKRLNFMSTALPIGSFCAVRIDLPPSFAGNQLFIPQQGKHRVAPDSVMNGVGRY